MKITEARRADVQAVLDAHLATGGAAAMLTLTIPHTRFQKVAETRRAVADAWKRVQQGVGWRTGKAKAGFVGSIRALEVTHGRHGWHPHLHVVILLKPHDNPGSNLDNFGGLIFDRWARAVDRLGFGTCSRQGFSVEPITDARGVARYCQKWGAAEELTKAHIKAGRGGGRSPWQILADLADEGRPRDRALFREYAEAFKGARQLTWSVGLRDLYLDTPEADDAEIAADPDEPASSDADAALLLTIKRAVWMRVVAARLQGALLTAADRAGVEGVLDLLTRSRIPFATVGREGMHGQIVTGIVEPPG